MLKPKSFERLASFDLSQRVSLVVLVSILTVYSAITVQEISNDFYFPDYEFLKFRLDKWEPVDIFSGFEVHLRYALLKSSLLVFGNAKVVPFFLSLGLLITTYFFAIQLARTRLAGPVATAIVVASNIFRNFDTSPAYEYSWVLFYILSLYFIANRWHLSPICFVASIFCKPLTVVFLPMTIYFICKSTIPTKTKYMLFFVYGLLVVGGIILSDYGLRNDVFVFRPDTMLEGVLDWWLFLAIGDMPYAVGLLLVMFWLGMYHFRVQLPYSSAILVCILGVILSTIFIEGFTVYYNESYRMVPLIVFFGVAVGMLIQPKPNIRSQPALSNHTNV